MIISYVKIIAFQLSLFCKNYRFSKTVLYMINIIQNNTWVRGNTRFISRVACSTLEINLVFPRTHDVLYSI